MRNSETEELLIILTALSGTVAHLSSKAEGLRRTMCSEANRIFHGKQERKFRARLFGSISSHQFRLC